MKNFSALHQAAQFYRDAKSVKLPSHLKNQLLRAASSICLNLAEGRGRRTRKDQLRHFYIALGSARECQGVLIIEDLEGSELWQMIDRTTASIYLLIKNAR